MRVIAGTHRGRPLTPPRRTRGPTADRVREALFSMLGDVTDADVLDLYAGSGALGIEALSRGAAGAVFVDTRARGHGGGPGQPDDARRAGRGGRAATPWTTCARWRASAASTSFFCDPPYDSALAVAPSLAELLPAVLYDTSVTVTESDTRTPLDLPFPVVRERAYGTTRIVIHRGF